MEISDTLIVSALTKIKVYENSTIPDNSEIEHTFSNEFERKMDKVISSFDKKGRYVSFGKNLLTKAAVILITLCLGAFSLMMTSPQARADFRNAVIEFYESHIKFYFISDSETAEDFKDIENVCAEYTPQDFTLIKTYNEYEAIGYRYENTDGSLGYDVYVSFNDGLSVLTDKDKDNIEEIPVNGKLSYLISGENDGVPYSTLIIPGNKITVTIYGQIIKEEIINIGKSITEKQ